MEKLLSGKSIQEKSAENTQEAS